MIIKDDSQQLTIIFKFYRQMNPLYLTIGILITAHIVTPDVITTDQHIMDFRQLSMLKRVSKIKNLNYSYSLVTGTWSQFPELVITFDIQMAQFVQITQNIQMWSSGNDYFWTRIIIDKVQNPQYRIATGHYMHHSHFISMPVWMQIGVHTVYVEYKTNGTIPAQNPQDWNQARFKIDYYKKVTS